MFSYFVPLRPVYTPWRTERTTGANNRAKRGLTSIADQPHSHARANVRRLRQIERFKFVLRDFGGEFHFHVQARTAGLNLRNDDVVISQRPHEQAEVQPSNLGFSSPTRSNLLAYSSSKTTILKLLKASQAGAGRAF